MTKLVTAILALCMVFCLASCNYTVELKDTENGTGNSESGANAESIVTEALVEEIVLNFGAEKAQSHTGTEIIQPHMVSLYYSAENLISEAMTPGDYFSWQFGYVRSLYTEDNWDKFVASHQSPYGEDTGFFYPQEEYEANVMKYFDVTTDFLRSDPRYYHAEEKGYWVDGGPGRGDTPTITIEGYEVYDEYLDIGLTLSYQGSGDTAKVLTVKLQDGGYQYQSYANGYLYDMESGYPVDDTQFRAAALKMGYSERYLDFLRDYRRSISPDDLLSDSELSLQTEFDREIAVIDDWLSLSPDQLVRNASKTVAASADGTKVICVFYDSEAYYSPFYYIWCDKTTGENRLLCCPYSDCTAHNPDDDLLLIYDHLTLNAFDINTGKKLANAGPQFDFGRRVSYQTEHCLVALGYDSGAKYYVAGYGDWLTQNEGENVWQIKLAVFSRNGQPLRSFATGVFVPVSVKNFWLYSDKVSFPSAGQVMMRFYDYGAVSCSYLTTGAPPAAVLDKSALLTLWEALEGKWERPDSSVAFLLIDGKPTLTFGDVSGEASGGEKLSDTVWSVTIKIDSTEKVYHIDTGEPRDNKILIKQDDSIYSEYTYMGN